MFGGAHPAVLDEPAAAVEGRADVELDTVSAIEEQLTLLEVQPLVQDVVRAQELRYVSEADPGEHVRSTLAEAHRQADVAQRIAEQRQAAARNSG